MPRDLDQLAQDADYQDRWRMPRWSNDLETLAGQQQMTHQPEQSNPAKPYLEGAERFYKSGLTGAIPGIRRYIPGPVNTLGDIVQSQAARDALSTANTGGLPLVQSMITREGLPVFHGSPEKFDRFLYSKAGTGAGSGYGHGLYFAEHPDVAKSYQGLGGYLYESGLRMDPEHFIDFNKPFSRQTNHVQSIMNELGYGGIPDHIHILNALRMLQEDKVTSDTLLAHGGIKGFRYLDQFSRRRGHGTRNYVVFNDKLIDIYKRHGPAALAALMAKGYFDFQRDEPQQ